MRWYETNGVDPCSAWRATPARSQDRRRFVESGGSGKDQGGRPGVQRLPVDCAGAPGASAADDRRAECTHGKANPPSMVTGLMRSRTLANPLHENYKPS